MHDLGGIRTRNPSNLATVHLGLTPHGHWICYVCLEFRLNLRQREFHFQMDALYYSARSAVLNKKIVRMPQLKTGKKKFTNK